jgi:hypothetical protein
MLTQAATIEGGRRLQRADRQWDVKAVRRYMLQADCFLEMLLCSVHITSRQPGDYNHLVPQQNTARPQYLRRG